MLCTGFLELRIVAAVELHTLLFNVGNFHHHVIEKLAIMGDQQQGSGIALKPRLEPDHRIEVEMVGRLVEQQQVGPAHQRTRQI